MNVKLILKNVPACVASKVKPRKLRPNIGGKKVKATHTSATATESTNQLASLFCRRVEDMKK